MGSLEAYLARGYPVVERHSPLHSFSNIHVSAASYYLGHGPYNTLPLGTESGGVSGRIRGVRRLYGTWGTLRGVLCHLLRCCPVVPKARNVDFAVLCLIAFEAELQEVAYLGLGKLLTTALVDFYCDYLTVLGYRSLRVRRPAGRESITVEPLQLAQFGLRRFNDSL